MNLKYGFSYYPEHCNSYKEIDIDIDIIASSGANVVRMGEFAWDQMEKHEGEFDFDVFTYTVNELGKRGVYTVMCTPTACPPAWLMKKHPEISYVDYRGVKRPFGARHHYCYNSPIYREYSKIIAEKMSEVFGDNPYVIGFQIGNEFAQEHSGRCHCDVCKEKFRTYLKNKYKTIDGLNFACGTYAWGESYTSFDEVDPPYATYEATEPDLIHDFYDNPGLRLNFDNFSSDSLCEYLEIQRKALKPSGKIITTNSTGLGRNQINYYDFFENLDILGFDIYPSLWEPDHKVSQLTYAFCRSIKHKPFWALEFAIGGGHGLWAKEGRLQPLPGAIELEVMHAFASGVELLAHFQYKQFRSGAEQLNYALLDTDRVPRRRFFDFQNTAKAIEANSSILENTFVKKPDTAIIFDYNALWALLIKPVNHDFSYIEFVSKFYDTLRAIGCEADIVSPKADLCGYKLVIAPSPIVTDKEYIENLKDFVSNGGTLLGTFLSSVKDYDNVGYDVSLPAHLTDVFGTVVSEVEPVFESSRATIDLGFAKSVNRHWIDELEPCGAEVIGTFIDTYRKGKVIVTKNRYNNGTAYYMGTMPEDDAFKSLLEKIVKEAGIDTVPFSFPECCTVVTRTGDKKTYYYVFNYGKEEVTVDFGKSHTIGGLSYICIEKEA